MAVIQILAHAVKRYPYLGVNPLLRIYALKSFTTAEGETIQGSSPGSDRWDKEIECTVFDAIDSDGDAIQILHIPTFELESTTDSVDFPDSASYGAYFVDGGEEKGAFQNFSDFILPHNEGNPLTWKKIRLANLIFVGASPLSAGFLLNRENHEGTQLAATISDFAAAADARINAFPIATAGGKGLMSAAHAASVAALLSAAFRAVGIAPGNLPEIGGDGKLPSSIIPASAITNTYVVNSEAAMLALAAQEGDVAIRTDITRSFILKGANPASLADWQELLTPGDAVLSVNGQTGIVNLTKAHIALANLVNALQLETIIIPAGSPLSAAFDLLGTDGARRATLDIAAASGAERGTMSAADFLKLAGIAAGATANSPDAFLLARGNHQGTQTAATISDFNAKVFGSLIRYNADALGQDYVFPDDGSVRGVVFESAQARSVYLPTVAAKGRFVIKKWTNSLASITFRPKAGENALVEGAATFSINTYRRAIGFESDGVDWWAVNDAL